MTTPEKPEDSYGSAELNTVQPQKESEKAQRARPAPAPVKGRDEVKPAARAAPAPPAKAAPSAAAPAPPSRELEQPAAEVCSHFPLGEAARPLLQDGQDARTFLQTLVIEEHYVDAIKVLAHALGKREAVWWACQCCRQGAAAEKPPEIPAALKAAERASRALGARSSRQRWQGIPGYRETFVFLTFCRQARPASDPKRSVSFPPGELRAVLRTYPSD
jgi:hypothetical protein